MSKYNFGSFVSGSIPFCEAWLQSLVDLIEIDDAKIRIKGSRDVLGGAILASRNRSNPGWQMGTEWRAICYIIEKPIQFTTPL